MKKILAILLLLLFPCLSAAQDSFQKTLQLHMQARQIQPRYNIVIIVIPQPNGNIQVRGFTLSGRGLSENSWSAINRAANSGSLKHYRRKMVQ